MAKHLTAPVPEIIPPDHVNTDTRNPITRLHLRRDALAIAAIVCGILVWHWISAYHGSQAGLVAFEAIQRISDATTNGGYDERELEASKAVDAVGRMSIDSDTLILLRKYLSVEERLHKETSSKLTVIDMQMSTACDTEAGVAVGAYSRSSLTGPGDCERLGREYTDELLNEIK